MKKIAVVGPESSGKSRLCQFLLGAFRLNFATEFSRDYLTSLNRPYRISDLDHIATGQFELISAASAGSFPFLLSDTEVLTVKIWSIVKYGSHSSLIEDLWLKQEFDHYLLCRPDLPWEADSLRECPDQKSRDRIFELFRSELSALNRRFSVIGGSWENRIELARPHFTL